MTDEWATKSVDLLMQAAAMLRLDADEWKSRKAPDHHGRTRDQMLSIAASNEGMARLMVKHAEALKPAQAA